MICPNCGAPMGEEQLLCEKCGHEIMLVEEYDPNLDVAEKTEDKKKKGNALWQNGPNLSILVVSGLLILIVFLSILVSLYNTRINSPEYKLEQARKMAAEGNYTGALENVKSVREALPDRMDLEFLEIDYYLAMQNESEAREHLKRLIDSSQDRGVVLDAYTRLIGLYEYAGDYEGIKELLDNAGEDISRQFQEYLAPAPEFSIPGGSYDTEQALKLVSGGIGTIYYTLDGTIPKESSAEYVTPIFLTRGDYEISAVFINNYGVSSDVVSAKYHVEEVTLESSAPVVDCYSGSYDHATLITVKAPENWKVYYTTKGEDPTDKSSKYAGPIPMPVGDSVMKFIAYDENGEPGEITEREYSLHIKDGIRVSEALTKVMEYQILAGKVITPEGLAADYSGVYSYRMFYCIPVEDYGDYYLVYEFLEDFAGNKNQTGEIFAVSLTDGTVTKAYYDRNGTYMIEGLEKTE